MNMIHGQRRALLAASIVLTACAALLGLGCAGDPFDPDSVINHPPRARIYVGSVSGDSLSPTSYFDRTFYWSGSDVDGFVTEYHVSIETEEGMAAPWVVTDRTDTTMTFNTDDLGQARALIRVACRDDRGAMSDTVSQYLPLKNFPPIINFVTDYDTFFWSYSSANFRFFALDLDGNVTMDDSVTFYLDTADTLAPVLVLGEEGADPALRRVRQALNDVENGEFEIELHGNAQPGERTLNVIIEDEADSAYHFTWTWDVRPVTGPVLMIDDFAGDFDIPTYHHLMDEVFGEDSWPMYNLEDGLPDRLWVLTETLRQFECVFWYTGSSTSTSLITMADQLADYLFPNDETVAPGKMLIVSKAIIGGTTQIPPSLIQNSLGIISQPTTPPFFIPQNKVIYSYTDDGDDTNDTSVIAFRMLNNRCGSVGLNPRSDAEAIYQAERRTLNTMPQARPFVGVRFPSRELAPVASAVTISLQWENIRSDDVLASFRSILADELGVVLP